MGAKKNISIVLAVVLVLLIAATFIYYSGILVPNSLREGNFKTELVEKGSVVSAIKASGVVESESEVLILSPASSLIKKILL